MYRIKYTPLAREDMLEILTYVSDDLSAPGSAFKLLDRIEKNIPRLKDNPYSSPVPRDEYLKSQGFHCLVAGKYLILYKVDDDLSSVVIYRVVYGRRNLMLLFPEFSDRVNEADEEYLNE